MPTLLQFGDARKQSPYRSRNCYLAKERQGLVPSCVARDAGRRLYLLEELQAVALARAAGATDGQIRQLVRQLEAKRPSLAEVLGAQE